MDGARCCLVCDIEWRGDAPCLSCQGPGTAGKLADFCPHGKRKPYRGWPCPACRASTIETARKLQDLGGGLPNRGWAY